MSAEGIADVAGVLANRTRAAFCDALLDGRPWSVSQLARKGGVSLSTASEHATVLVQAELCREHRQGSSRYLQLADPRVAACLEDLASLVEPRPVAARTLRAASKSQALARGRTCYDHLAGRLGVAITEALRDRGVLDATLAVTPAGLEWMATHLDGPVPAGRRPLSRTCLDWTERRPHLAGAAGARLCAVLFDRRWIRRIGADRAVVLTSEGEERLTDLLGPWRGEVP
ncbi:DNA-binding transcriptional ArsR family regulator [Lipingzhangella halophila]|uniref:DNA-binding transcriptional ArsR family regulator n=1 Tax=Lipingzhangella halophila TaxID=1783352 RepID=A0A7W7RL16_9ACTN|nr:winged helix-turn-helix domain-containing protein [Lipingzhangella halophila]MBB4933948.1 DNA-binding transcriptional ArsR family regulator [Lipingzhangella halophila]